MLAVCTVSVLRCSVVTHALLIYSVADGQKPQRCFKSSHIASVEQIFTKFVTRVSPVLLYQLPVL